MTSMTGMHEFAEFAAADVGTVDSGLNSIVLASNNEMVRAMLVQTASVNVDPMQIERLITDTGNGLCIDRWPCSPEVEGRESTAR